MAAGRMALKDCSPLAVGPVSPPLTSRLTLTYGLAFKISTLTGCLDKLMPVSLSFGEIPEMFGSQHIRNKDSLHSRV
jgi:hypothetical protein